MSSRTRPSKRVTTPTFEDFPMSEAEEARQFREQFFQEAREGLGMMSPQDVAARAQEAERERRKLAEPEITKLHLLDARIEKTLQEPGLTLSQSVTLLSELRKIVQLRAELSGALPPRTIQYD